MSDIPTDRPDGVDPSDDIQAANAESPPVQAKGRFKAYDDIPEPIYRLKTLHSSETSFGYYVHAGADWPHFRSRTELELLLEGPIAQQSAPAKESSSTESPAGEEIPPPADGEPDLNQPQAPQDSQVLQAPRPEPEATSPAPHSTEQHIPLRSLAVAPTKYGKDIVEIQGIVLDKSSINLDELVLIERPAGIDDLRRLNDNREKERQAYVLCRDKIWARNLPMKLVSAHYLLDEPKILFYFTAESRVDFRELVKDLVSVFKMRIELRQIGVRDEARVTGGCGVCGRVLCCHGISDRLNPVSIKMAKDQNLSLNSLKISGPCGRLLCCLSYEHQFYKDARRELPQEGAKFIYDGTLFKVVEVNALGSTVKMAGEDGRVLDMKAERFKYEEGRWKVVEVQA
jgi:cell fate regulator YaaT (PSP1 superfamily)